MISVFWIIMSTWIILFTCIAVIIYLTKDIPTFEEKRQKKMWEELLEKKEKEQKKIWEELLEEKEKKQ